MIKSKFAKILDNIFIFVGSFFLSFCLLKYYIQSPIILSILALFISLMVLGLSFFMFTARKQEQKKKKAANELFDKLMFCGDEDVRKKLIEHIANKYEVKQNQELIIFNKTAFCTCFGEPLSVSIFGKFYFAAKKENLKKLIILCAEANPKTKTYLNKTSEIKVEILEGIKCYDFLKWLKIEEPKSILKPERNKFLKTFSGFISPDKSKRYFALFIIFLSFSFISNFSVYFIVFASLMLSLSVLSKFDLLNRLKK